MSVSDFTSPIHLTGNVKKQATATLPIPKGSPIKGEEEVSTETMDFINLEKSIREAVSREQTHSNVLTPLQKLRRSLSGNIE